MDSTSIPARLWRWFLQGIAVIAPVLITIGFLIWIGNALEDLIGGVLRRLLPYDWYMPGMGLATGLALTLALGLLANVFLVRWIVRGAERVLDRIPLVKTIFQGLKDIAGLFIGDHKDGLGHAVAVQIGEMYLVGFVMQAHAELPTDEIDYSELMAVYLPLSYQIGGYTIYVDKSKVTPLAVSAEEAMRAVLIGSQLRRKL